MDIAVAYEGDAAVVAVEGHLNTNTAGDLERTLADVFGRTYRVTLDFSRLEYLSSAGLRVLVGAQRRIMKAGGTLRITGTVDDVREVFEITGLIDVLDVE